MFCLPHPLAVFLLGCTSVLLNSIGHATLLSVEEDDTVLAESPVGLSVQDSGRSPPSTLDFALNTIQEFDKESARREREQNEPAWQAWKHDAEELHAVESGRR